MANASIDKIYKELDKADIDELAPIFGQIKSYIDAKLLDKARQLQEEAEKYQSLSAKINGN